MPTPRMIKVDLHTPPKSASAHVIPKDILKDDLETSITSDEPEDEVSRLKVAPYSGSVKDKTESLEAETFNPKKAIASPVTAAGLAPPVTTDTVKLISALSQTNTPKNSSIKESNETNNSSKMKR